MVTILKMDKSKYEAYNPKEPKLILYRHPNVSKVQEFIDTYFDMFKEILLIRKHSNNNKPLRNY